LLGNVFALHDRSQFEVFAFSCGPDDASIYRKSIVASVDHYVDAHAMTDDELASDIAQRELAMTVPAGITPSAAGGASGSSNS